MGDVIQVIVEVIDSAVFRISYRRFSAGCGIVGKGCSFVCRIFRVFYFTFAVVMGDCLAGSRVGYSGSSFQGIVLKGGGYAGFIRGGLQQAVNGLGDCIGCGVGNVFMVNVL